VVLVAVATGAGWWVLVGAPRASERAARDTAVAFAAAWESQDWPALAARVTPPSGDAVATHERMLSELGSEALTVSLERVEVDGTRARAAYVVAVDVDGFGPDPGSGPTSGPTSGPGTTWSYESAFDLERIDGQWSVAWTPAVVHPLLTAERGFRVARTWPDRAPILGAGDVTLVAERDTVTVGIEPQRLSDPATARKALVEAAGASASQVDALLGRDDLRPEWFYPVIELSRERFDEADAQLRPVPGIVFRATEGRSAPSSTFARALLGTVEAISEERAAQLGEPYEPGDQAGLGGLEAAYETQLAGRPEIELQLVASASADSPDAEEPGEEPAEPTVVEVLATHEGTPAEPLRTTLDPSVQQVAEEALTGAGLPAALVVIDVASGGLRAVANSPPDGFNRALTGRYPPGSTFKVVTAAAALAAGTSPETAVDCPAERSVGGRSFTNAGGAALGTIPFRTAFAESCNTAFVALAEALGAEALGAAAESFGFNTNYDAGVSTFGGSFPEPDDPVELAAAGIGQARVEASPMHMASVAAAVARGAWRAPHLVAAHEGGERPVLGDTAVLGDLMREVVASGTGTAAQLATEEATDEPLAGKTGSAEFGTEVPPQTHAWFIGFRGDLAFAVVVEGGGAGGAVAAPIAAELLRTLDQRVR
jgi:cell division protein FtsI/penicillin-binding protein 2